MFCRDRVRPQRFAARGRALASSPSIPAGSAPASLSADLLSRTPFRRISPVRTSGRTLPVPDARRFRAPGAFRRAVRPSPA